MKNNTEDNYFDAGLDIVYNDLVMLYSHNDSTTMVLNGNIMLLERIFGVMTYMDISCNHLKAKYQTPLEVSSPSNI